MPGHGSGIEKTRGLTWMGSRMAVRDVLVPIQRYVQVGGGMCQGPHTDPLNASLCDGPHGFQRDTTRGF